MDFASWQLEFHSGIPVYKQIVHQIEAAIASGALTRGEQLPTIRALHERLGINPNTVARAYRELESLGVIEARRGSGSFVAEQPKPTAALKPRERDAKLHELVARLRSEAQSHRIPLRLIVQQLQDEPSPE